MSALESTLLWSVVSFLLAIEIYHLKKRIDHIQDCYDKNFKTIADGLVGLSKKVWLKDEEIK